MRKIEYTTTHFNALIFHIQHTLFVCSRRERLTKLREKEKIFIKKIYLQEKFVFVVLRVRSTSANKIVYMCTSGTEGYAMRCRSCGRDTRPTDFELSIIPSRRYILQ